MSIETLPDGWTRVKFGDVVRKVSDRVDPETSGIERYVAGEHMDTDDLRLRRWGEVGDGYLGPAFHMCFKPGQVLYGSRRTYLRKVAVADFVGICANTTFVLEPSSKDLLPEFLPLVMTTEAFHDHSIKQSKGSVNPYINFSDLTWYEFALPPLDEQQRIVELLSAVSKHQNSLKKQVDVARGMRDAVLSSFLDSGNQAWSSKTLREIIQVCTGGIWGSDPGSDEVDILVYRQTEFDDEGRLACGSGVKRSASKRQLESRTLQPGDILLQKSAGTPSLPGRVVLVPTAIERDATCSNFLQLIRANTKYCESLFLFWVLWYRHRRGLALEFQRGTNIRNLDLNRYLGKSVLLPSLAEQKRFVKTVSLIDDFIRKSEQALVESLHLSAVLRNFSLEVRDVH